MLYDPRPVKCRAVELKLLETLHCDMLQFKQKCAFTNILLPLTKNIERDHCYHYKSTEISNNNSTVDTMTTFTLASTENVISRKLRLRLQH